MIEYNCVGIVNFQFALLPFYSNILLFCLTFATAFNSSINSREKSAKSEIIVRGVFMPKPTSLSGRKNLISQHLIQLRKQRGLSQRALAQKLQLAGYDIDKNVITRIKTNKRYVTDIELKALSSVLNVNYTCLIDGTESLS